MKLVTTAATMPVAVLDGGDDARPGEAMKAMMTVKEKQHMP